MRSTHILGTPLPRTGQTGVETLLFYAGQVPSVISVVALLMLALAYDRSLALVRAAGPMQQLTDALRPMLRAGDLAAALNTAAQSRGSAARVAQQALQQGLGTPGRQSAVARASLEAELATVRRRLPWARDLAGFATLLGLFGSVVTFAPMVFVCFPARDDASWATMHAKSVSECLVSTEAGLLLAALSLSLAVGLSALVKAFEAALRREMKTLLGMLRTYRPQLRFQVGDTTLRVPKSGPATYRTTVG
ncbi:MAG: MotA/TolQ/ExbB proton channel family protein [Sandaracinaceae bacterium]